MKITNLYYYNYANYLNNIISLSSYRPFIILLSISSTFPFTIILCDNFILPPF